MHLPKVQGRSYIESWGVCCKGFEKYYSYVLLMKCVYDSFDSVPYKLNIVSVMSVDEEEPTLLKCYKETVSLEGFSNLPLMVNYFLLLATKKYFFIDTKYKGWCIVLAIIVKLREWLLWRERLSLKFGIEKNFDIIFGGFWFLASQSEQILFLIILCPSFPFHYLHLNTSFVYYYWTLNQQISNL